MQKTKKEHKKEISKMKEYHMEELEKYEADIESLKKEVDQMKE